MHLGIEPRHYLQHRKKLFIKKKASFSSSSNIPSQGFQFDINAPLNLNFSTHPPEEMFVFGATNENISKN